MARVVRVVAGKKNIALPNSHVYDGQVDVTLTDAQFASIPSGAFTGGTLVDLGAVTDPLGVGATAARPDPAAVPIGAGFYDLTIHKPIWSDGAVWRDAAGTSV